MSLQSGVLKQEKRVTQKRDTRFSINVLPIMYSISTGAYFTSSNIKYIDNQLVTVIKIQMICKCKYKTI